MHKNYSDNSIKFSNLRRKFIKKATYTTPLLLSLGSLTKPQVAGGSHVVSPPIQIPAVPPDGEAPPGINTFTRDQHSANYNPLFNSVRVWLGTTRFWGGGLITARETDGFLMLDEAEYINTYGFAKIQYGLQEPRHYKDGCSSFDPRTARCQVVNRGYLSLRNSRPGLTDDRRLTEAEYLITRSFETERTRYQANIFTELVLGDEYSDVRSLIGLDGADHDQIRAHYDLAAYNHYTREILGHEFDLVNLEQAREWQVALNAREALGDLQNDTLFNAFDPVIRDRMLALRNYDLLRDYDGGIRDRYVIARRTAEDVLGRIRTNDECQSIEAVFSQLCGDFDPYKF